MTDPITVTTLIDCNPATAFNTFVQDIAHWWPMAPFSIAEGDLVFEAKPAGRIIETVSDGTQHVWGHVTEWMPPQSLGVLWYVGSTPDKATRITVRFDPTDDQRTAITLTHDGWDVLGDQALSMRDRYDAGWKTILAEHFAPYANKPTEHTNPD